MRLPALAVLSGALISLALPNELFPLGNPLIGLVCLTPLFYAAGAIRGRRGAALAFGLFGAVSTAAGNYWLFFFKDFALWTIGPVTIAYALIYAVVGVFVWSFSTPGPARPFLVALVWTVFEFVKANGYLAYPWGLMAYPFNTVLPLLQSADIAGVYAVGAWAALANSLAAETLLAAFPAAAAGPRAAAPVGRLARAWVFFALLSALIIGYGLARMSVGVPRIGQARLALIQQNSDPWIEGKEDQALRQSQDLTRAALAASGRRPDLVVWSETALYTPYSGFEYLYENKPRGDSFPAFLREINTPLLTGAPLVVGRVPLRIMNGAVLLSPAGATVESYGKRHPVPMAEHVPFWDAPPVQWFFKNVIGLHSIWTLGGRSTVFDLPASDGGRLRFAAPICFEDAFAYLCRDFALGGADMLINLTNDGWSRTRSAQYQHFAAARFRAIELKRVLVRSTNSGYTCVVDPFGRVTAELPMFEPAFVNVEVPVYREQAPTAYLLFGDYFPVLAAVFLAGWLARRAFRRR